MTRNERGSMTIEAAIVFPFFMALILLLINIINIASVQVAMDHAVGETVKQIAAYSYPLNEVHSRVFEFDNSTNFFPGAGSLLEACRGYLNTGASSVLQSAIKAYVEKEIKEFYPLSNLHLSEDLNISGFKIYNPIDTKSRVDNDQGELSDKDISMTVEYKVKIIIPFCPLKEVHLTSSATERAWVD